MQYCETGVSCPQWTKWTTWTSCSHDCGIGERLRHRECSSADGPADSCEGKKSVRNWFYIFFSNDNFVISVAKICYIIQMLITALT